ncbi:MAG: L-ribulose-5-phosphate 4-epimerase [Acidaminococcaceae bacterium]|nr:L-ribulose-5-phosphate 4-epimerase [Acidaminococcaceae bacterium]
MLDELKELVCQANLELVRQGLVIYTWGNVSAIDTKRQYVVIKPSGVSYTGMSPQDMVIVNLDGEVVEGELLPSSDLPTHLELYRQCPNIHSIAHTHSRWATSWAQAARSIPALGTTHADYFYGDVPCSRALTSDEINKNYELNTGKVIAEVLHKQEDVNAVPGILVANHGPFTWGITPSEAVYHSVVLETIAEMAYHTLVLNPTAKLNQDLLDKHYHRKHGKSAYYGQK